MYSMKRLRTGRWASYTFVAIFLLLIGTLFFSPKLYAAPQAAHGDKVAVTDSTEPAADEEDEEKNSGDNTNCSGGAFGWVLCPAINYMAKATQLIATLVDGFMQVKFLSSEGGGKNIERIWRAMLSIANILLVIAFMFIIFSQSSSLGLSNYGIKKMLPRLIIAAILMNLSFYICAIAIDFSNIIGGSIMGFLLGSDNTIASSVTAATGDGNSFLYSAGSATATAAIGVGLVILLFCFFGPILLGFLIVLIALVGRQVILLALVLVSPLAFVAWLLPNTEKYFKKWSDLFLQLLIIYPVVMTIFGASLLLSNLLGATGADLPLGGSGEPTP